MARLFRTPDRTVWFVGTLLVLAALSTIAGVISARPARVLGVDGSALGYSVARHSGGVSLGPDRDRCVLELPDSWTCLVSSDGSDALEYVVHTDSDGCWKASRRGPAGGISPAPRRASGCIGVRDYIRFSQRVLVAPPTPPR